MSLPHPHCMAQRRSSLGPGIETAISIPPSRSRRSTGLPTCILRSLRSLTPTLSPFRSAMHHFRYFITSEKICNPLLIYLPSGSPVPALAAAGGWKERSLAASCLTLEGMSCKGLSKEEDLEAGLAEVASQVALYSSRHLIWAAEQDQVNPFNAPSIL